MYDYDRRSVVAAGLPATVGGFLQLLRVHMTQWDKAQEAAATKKREHYNIYTLSHLFGAVERLEQHVGGASKAKSSDPLDLAKLRDGIAKFLHDAPYVRKTVKAINEFLERGKAPKYPVQKAG